MIRPRLLSVCAAASLFVAAIAGPAAAQPKDASTVKQLFLDGKAALDLGDYPTACGKFEQAVALDPTAIGALAALADCDEKWGHTASAYNAYVRLEGETAKDDAKKDALEYARKKIKELEPKLGKLTIDVPAALGREDLRIERDGALVPSGVYGVPVPIDPGAHVVVVRATGRKDWTKEWTQSDGQPTSITIELGPDDTSFGPSGNTNTSFWSGPRIAGLVVGLVGLGTIGASLGVGGAALGSYNDSNAHGCSAATNVCPAGAPTDERQTALDLSNVSTALFVVGAVATGVGVIVFAVAPRAKADTSPSTPSVAVGPGWVGLRGSF